MVSSAARAYIEQSETGGSTTSVTAAGNVNIEARDAASIDAKTELRGATSTSNDGGLGIVNGLASTLLDQYQYTTASGERAVQFGERVRVADSYAGGGEGGAKYEYMGSDPLTNLGTAELR